MRRRLRHFVVALIVALFLAGTLLLARTLWLQRQADLGNEVLDLLPQVAQRIRDFRRTRVVDGRKVWEISAREAQYFDEQNLAVVSEPFVSFFAKDGREVALRGEEGRVYLGGRELEKVELKGEIEVKFDEYELHTDAARYERARDTITSPGPVQISGENLDIRGDTMVLDLSGQQLRVEGHVRMLLRPGA